MGLFAVRRSQVPENQGRFSEEAPVPKVDRFDSCTRPRAAIGSYTRTCPVAYVLRRIPSEDTEIGTVPANQPQPQPLRFEKKKKKKGTLPILQSIDNL